VNRGNRGTCCEQNGNAVGGPYPKRHALDFRDQTVSVANTYYGGFTFNELLFDYVDRVFMDLLAPNTTTGNSRLV
jgi:hypothetical protein